MAAQATAITGLCSTYLSTNMAKASELNTAVFMDFQSTMAGKRPLGFRTVSNQLGWVTIIDPDDPARRNKVLTHYILGGTSPDGNYALIESPAEVNPASNRKAGFTLSVKIKVVAGKEPRCGGLVTAFHNPSSFSFVALETFHSMVKHVLVTNLNRRQTINAVPKGDLNSNKWYLLKAIYSNRKLSFFIDGVQIFEFVPPIDNRKSLFGLYTCNGSLALFDDLNVQPGITELR